MPGCVCVRCARFAYSRNNVYKRFISSRGYKSQLYLEKYEVSLGKVAFFRVTDFTSGNSPR